MESVHYQIKRSFENQVILTEEKDDFLNFYAINDGFEKFEDVYVEIQVIDFNGEIVDEIVHVPNGKVLDKIVKFDTVEIENLIPYLKKNELFLKLTLKDINEKVIAENLHFFAKPKDLKLPKPNIKIKKISETEIEVSTDVLAKDVYLMGDMHFSDNFFDLLPKSSKRIQLTKPLQKIDVMSLFDTMNETK